MNKEPAMLLVAALRSGEFKQGKNRLEDNSNGDGPLHCCLGVACIIATRQKVPLTVECDEYQTIRGTYLNSQPNVADWLGVKYCGRFPDSLTAELGVRNVVDSLAALNDEGMTFDQIADFIEKHWEQIT